MNRAPHPFRVLDESLSLLHAVVPLLHEVERRDRPLADQLRRAAQSIHLNLSESRGVRAGHRRERLRTALGSAYETRGALEVAMVFGYVGERAARAALARVDAVAAMVYRLAQ